MKLLGVDGISITPSRREALATGVISPLYLFLVILDLQKNVLFS